MKRIVLSLFLVLAFSLAVFSQTNTALQKCPNLKIVTVTPIIKPVKKVEFAVKTENTFINRLKFNWKARGAKIINGQGTSALTVFSESKDSDIEIFLTLTVEGLPNHCSNRFQEMVVVCFHRSQPILFDTYQVMEARQEKNATINSFLTEVKKTESDQAIFEVIYQDDEDLKNRLRRITSDLVQENFDLNRVWFAINKEKNPLTRFWIFPQPKENHFDKRYTIITAEELIEKLNKLPK